MHAKPDLRVEFEPYGHFFRLGDLCRSRAGLPLTIGAWSTTLVIESFLGLNRLLRSLGLFGNRMLLKRLLGA